MLSQSQFHLQHNQVLRFSSSLPPVLTSLLFQRKSSTSPDCWSTWFITSHRLYHLVLEYTPLARPVVSGTVGKESNPEEAQSGSFKSFPNMIEHMTNALHVQQIGVHDCGNVHSTSIRTSLVLHYSQQSVRLHTECDGQHTDKFSCHFLNTHAFHQELKMNKALLNGAVTDEMYHHSKNLNETQCAIRYCWYVGISLQSLPSNNYAPPGG